MFSAKTSKAILPINNACVKDPVLFFRRVFVLLSALGQRALTGPSCVNIMESLLAILSKVLSPLTGSNGVGSSGFTPATERPRNMAGKHDGS